MENNFFSVSNEDLARLDANQAVKMVSELLWAEATRLGIPISKIHISANVNAPDDGVDAVVSEQPIIGDLIRGGHTAYQIKSGRNFQPQQDAVIRDELFGKGNAPGKENLKSRIRKCLDENGTYGLVCTAIDPADRSGALTCLKGHFSLSRHPDAKCPCKN